MRLGSLFTRKIIIVLCALFIFLGAGIYFSGGLVDIVPPDAATLTAIDVTFMRIDEYAKQHKSLPPSLDVLPLRNGTANKITDVWNDKLRYEVSASDGKINISGYGQLGPDGSKKLISKSYYATHEDGRLWVGTDPSWIVLADVEWCPRAADGKRNNYQKEFCKTSSLPDLK